MRFSNISNYLQKIEVTASRLEMTSLITSLLSELEHNDIAIISYLLTGRIAPKFVTSEFEMSTKSVIKAIAKLYPQDNVNALYKKLGDVGNVIVEVDKGNTDTKIDIATVYNLLWEIVKTEGKGSVEVKQHLLIRLLERLDRLSKKFVARLVSGRLRLGCNDRTVLAALNGILGDDFSEDLDYSYGVCSDIGYVSAIALTKGIRGIRKIEVSPGTPIASQLVERAKTGKDIMDRYDKIILQPKYDGMRCQVHILDRNTKQLNGKGLKEEKFYRPWVNYINKRNFVGLFSEPAGNSNLIKFFSRRLDDITTLFPELVEEIQKFNFKSAVFDCEVIGVDKSGKFSSFQETVKRKRKYDIAKTKEQVPVNMYAFDVIFLNGKSLLKVGNYERLKLLDQILKDRNSKIITSPYSIVSSTKHLEKLFSQYISKGLEGVIAKNPESFYQPGLRNFEWIKLKKSTSKDFKDTLDVVVLGYYAGRGKRAKQGIGAILTGIYDSNTSRFLTIAKIGTGITDAELMKIKNQLDKIAIPVSLTTPNSTFDNRQLVIPKVLIPDVLVEPTIVCVVEADEISKSDVHSSGYSLRFPRLIEFNRLDKSPEQVTTLDEIKLGV
ncbi:ATP-dependent DNA ligase [Candidatus Dojkabacteria bacterium]|nr:ATP-dependent DNA ligase [Candidatus Dojkabacteria bacterium]